MSVIRRLSAVIAGVVALALLLCGWLFRVELYDWWRLRGYQPPARIVQLADDTTMNGYARKIFYVNRPQLNDKTSFSQRCEGSEQSIILGCYISGEGIYLFNVADPRLKGIHEVTAAHEMLHAAYERLDRREREEIDAQLQSFFSTIKDERLQTTVAAYKEKDPSLVPNELHSILATEVRELPAGVESYYRRYFDDRARVVAYSEQYERAFTDLKQRVRAYDARLSEIKSRIENNERRLDGMSGDLEADRERMDNLLASGRNEAYNAAVPGFNAQVRAYNALLQETRELIGEYNRLVQERNSVALEEQELIRSINSHVPVQPHQ